MTRSGLNNPAGFASENYMRVVSRSIAFRIKLNFYPIFIEIKLFRKEKFIYMTKYREFLEYKNRCIMRHKDMMPLFISARCPENWFRCAYGGCIRPELKCNYRPNCYDWSDEDESLCGIGLPEGACRLPAARAGTRYNVSGCLGCRPDEVVPELTRLDYTCDLESSLLGPSRIYCQNNQWLPNIPTCILGN